VAGNQFKTKLIEERFFQVFDIVRLAIRPSSHRRSML
jgi:hypothetical protein